MTTTRRRRFVAKPTFQIKLTIIFMLMVTIVANLVGGLCYALISKYVTDQLESFTERFSDGPVFSDAFAQVTKMIIPHILLAEAISLLIVLVLCLWVTHTIAGPLYRLENVAKTIATGDLSLYTKLRPKDELRELADAFNTMTQGLAARIYLIKDAVDAYDRGAPPRATIGEVKHALAQFKLPLRETIQAAEILKATEPQEPQGEDDDTADEVEEDADPVSETSAPTESPIPPERTSGRFRVSGKLSTDKNAEEARSGQGTGQSAENRDDGSGPRRPKKRRFRRKGPPEASEQRSDRFGQGGPSGRFPPRDPTKDSGPRNS